MPAGREIVRAVSWICLLVVLLIMSYTEFAYTYEFSILVLAVRIYAYNPVCAFLGERADIEFGRKRRHALNLMLAVGCALNVMGGTILTSGMRGEIGMIMGEVEISSGYLLAFLLPAVAPLLGAMLVLLVLLDTIGKNHVGTFKKDAEMLISGSMALVVFAFFFGMVGETIIIYAIMVAAGAYAILALTRIRKPRDIGRIALGTMDKIEKLEKTAWMRWLEAGRTPQNGFLFSSLFVITMLSMFNAAFADYSKPLQIAYMALILLSLLLCYIGLSRSNTGWGYCSAPLAPLAAAIALSFVKIEAMPMIGIWYSFAIVHMGGISGEFYDILSKFVFVVSEFMIALIVSGFFGALATEARGKGDAHMYGQYALCQRTAVATGAFVAFLPIVPILGAVFFVLFLVLMGYFSGRDERRIRADQLVR